MIDLMLLLFLVVCAIAAVSMKDLLSTTIILGVYSLIMTVVWTRLNAVDVAFTEASVGAGITTVLIIAALSRTKREEEGQEYGMWSKLLNPQDLKLTDKQSPLLWLTSLFIVLITGAVLIYGTIDMPDFGDPDAPANIHLAKRFIEESYEETGVPNFVTAILASYRGYDTLGETTVIFTAGISLILLLRRKSYICDTTIKEKEMKEHIVIRTISRILIPFVQLYALYVIAHGELSPGGGFQGGVIFGSSIILYVIAFGLEEGRKVRIFREMGDLLNSTGVLIYAGIGVLCLLAGGAYLEYDKLPLGSEKMASSLGIYGIEIGVGITVAAVMITIFFITARHER
ncbi:MAG TPA: DUF4040 domain-containing protein [Nitrospinota bacterium]|jgi:multicomponent Na+:H+ antiporter subunit B|nr:DUF4040 domain-containing protein [Nitrospinota bacterium]|tara:strand:- start:5820 stop:6848 length:1029 start_codon:yes stop_codon:yes gene_type:complete